MNLKLISNAEFIALCRFPTKLILLSALALTACGGGSSDGFDNSNLPPKPIITNIEQMSFGNGHSCVLTDKGVSCWGRNIEKQNQVPALSNPVSIAAGGFHTCALDDTGVSCWGAYDNDPGFIPVDFGQRSPPVLNNPSIITSGGYHACAIDDAGIQCWGAGSTDADDKRNEGQLFIPVIQNPRDISAGRYHTCALGDNGVTCWGAGSIKIQDPADPNYSIDKGQSLVPTNLKNPRTIASGGWHSCAIDDNGIKCWGAGESEISNDAFDKGQSIVPSGIINPVQLSLGWFHSCARHDGGTTCWGNFSNSVPSDIDSRTANIAAGAEHSCGITVDGLQCWGSNLSGQGSVPVDLLNPALVATGHQHSCATDDNGGFCWGYNAGGQTDIDFTSLQQPIQQLALGGNFSCVLDAGSVVCKGISGVPALQNPQMVSAGLAHACAIDDSGLVCWPDTEPVVQSVPASLVNPKTVDAGWLHTCAIDANSVSCWGETSSAPAGLVNPVAVATGQNHACAIDDNGGIRSVSCWNLSDGSAFPVASGLVNPEIITAGQSHVCALANNAGSKSVVCWSDDSGNPLLFTSIPPLSNPQTLSYKANHACSLDDTGLVCWSLNDSGNNYGQAVAPTAP